MSSDFVDGSIVTNAAGSFSPGLPYVHAAKDFVALLSSGSQYNFTASKWFDSTFILGFDISGGGGGSDNDGTMLAPRPFCFAEISGATNADQWSADLYDGHLRVFTGDYVFNETHSSQTYKISVLKVPPPMSDAGTNMVVTGQISLDFTPTYDMTLFVRFDRNWGYFATSDGPPVSVYDLSDPSDPKMICELETSGDFTYLEAINIDGVPHLLGVGDTSSSSERGFKIIVFDMSDPTKPQQKISYVEEGSYTKSG